MPFKLLTIYFSVISSSSFQINKKLSSLSLNNPSEQQKLAMIIHKALVKKIQKKNEHLDGLMSEDDDETDSDELSEKDFPSLDEEKYVYVKKDKFEVLTEDELFD